MSFNRKYAISQASIKIIIKNIEKLINLYLIYKECYIENIFQDLSNFIMVF